MSVYHTDIMVIPSHGMATTEARFDWTNGGHRILLLLDECDHLVQQQQFQDSRRSRVPWLGSMEISREQWPLLWLNNVVDHGGFQRTMWLIMGV